MPSSKTVLNTLQEKITHLPSKPGVYLFFNGKGEVIYVGKSKSLRNRVRSYFQESRPKDPKTQSLVNKAADLEFIITSDEIEALILEANLIKEKHPYYNVSLRDDKTYPYVRVTNEEFPRVFVTRKIVRDGSRYFGPYTNVGSLRRALKVIRKVFPMRSCRYNITSEGIKAGKFEICLDYHIHKCQAPCIGLVSKEEYGEMITQIIEFLQGKTDSTIKRLQREMKKASLGMRYEEAARIRDQITALTEYSNSQSVASAKIEDRDIITVAVQERWAVATLFRIRAGKLIDRETFPVTGSQYNAKEEILYQFITQYYSSTDFITAEIDTEFPPSDREELEQWLSMRRNGAVHILQPKRGKKARLLKLCRENAEYELKELIIEKESRGKIIPVSVRELQEELALNAPPLRIDGFDISNIAGKYTVASMVVFENGKPKKSAYRRFKIKTVEGIDDFACMQEVINRRYSRVLKEQLPLPDMILIDGGKGQLSAAKNSLDKLGLGDLPVVGLAKRLEEIFLPEHNEPVLLPKTSPALILLQKIRNEAHRFAITYHRKIRGRSMIKSALDDIPGVGQIIKKRLLQKFKSVGKIREATPEEIASVQGVSLKLAQRIKQGLET